MTLYPRGLRIYYADKIADPALECIAFQSIFLFCPACPTAPHLAPHLKKPVNNCGCSVSRLVPHMPHLFCFSLRGEEHSNYRFYMVCVSPYIKVLYAFSGACGALAAAVGFSVFFSGALPGHSWGTAPFIRLKLTLIPANTDRCTAFLTFRPLPLLSIAHLPP